MNEYVPVRLSTIRPLLTLDFRVFIKLPSKYLLYVKPGDSLDCERLKSLKERKVKKLFISGEDESQYQSFLDRGLKEAIENSDMQSSERAVIVSGVASDAIEEVARDPGSEKAFEKTQKAAKGLQDVLKSDPQLLIALFDHEDSDCEADLFLKSALKGSTLAIKFAEALKMPQQTINDIGTAALLRDIGAKEELKIYQSKVSELSKEDLLTYRQHPAASEKLLLGKEFVSKKVLALIKRHEEKISGTGFPDKVSDLSKEEQLLSLVCAYDRLITVEALPCDDALKSLKIDEMGNYDLKLITQLGELLKREMLV